MPAIEETEIQEGVVERTLVQQLVPDSAPEAEPVYRDTVWLRGPHGKLFHVEVGSEAYLRLMEGQAGATPEALEQAFNDHASRVNHAAS
jgi:hypothetical protein